MTWDGRLRADARHLPIASESVQCIVTSPPYWGMRDYRQDGQIGMESTPREYINNIREVALELRQVLKKDGTLWLNLGDCFYSGNCGGYRKDSYRWESSKLQRGNRGNSDTIRPNRLPQSGLKDKDLVGMPWRIALALQEDGWYLRSDIIWHKPNPMPESVRDRPTKAHEYIFLLTKSEQYFYDADAIKESATYAGPNAPNSIKSPYGQGFSRRALDFRRETKEVEHPNGAPRQHRAEHKEPTIDGMRNKRSVWTISTQPYPEAQYATFPEELPEICIKAGSRAGDLVLDPFFGSGTVGRVAERLSRRWIGCDLGYQDLQAKRLQNVQRFLVGAS